MADFHSAFDRTIGFEGKYSVDPQDRGGETYKGISRKANPAWEGWINVDGCKNMPDFPGTLENFSELQKQVEYFYQQLWFRTGCHLITDQELAEALFDTAVNMGERRAVMFLQNGLNVLNRNESLWKDIATDGRFGEETKAALSIITTEEPILAKIVMILRGAAYLDILRNHPDQEKFARGWLARVTLT